MNEIGRYCTLILNIFMLFLLIATCFITVQLLLLSRKKLLFTPVFRVYLTFITLVCIICISNSCYVIISWRAAEPSYYPSTLYIMSIVSGGMMQATFIAESFLCVDRCFIIAFPKYYTYKAKILLGILEIFGLIGILFYQYYIFGALFIPEFIFNIKAFTRCPHIQCLFNNSDSEILFLRAKIRWGIINLALVIVLIVLIKFKIKMADIKNKLHYTVAMALLCTLVFEFVPNLIGVLINLLTSSSTTAYAGPYWTTSSIINIFICNIMYSKAILRRNVVNHTEVLSQI